MSTAAALLLIIGACTTAVDSPDVATVEPPTSSAAETSSEAPRASSGARVGSDGIGDRLYPTLGNGGYDVESYEFSLDVMSGGFVDAAAVVRIIPESDLEQFNLDLVGMEVESVRVDGVGATFSHVDRELQIVPAEPMSSGSPAMVEIEYSGVPVPVPADAVPFSPGWQTGDEVSYLFSQPDGASSIFPVNDHPADRAEVTLSVTVDSSLDVVSGGELVSEAVTAESKTVVWEMSNVAPYLIPLAIGRFELVSEQVIDGVTFDVWASEDLVTLPALETFDRQPDIVAFLEERFGSYPFDRAGALIVDDLFPAALETQTIPTYTLISAEWGEVVIAHELAHQWFGDAIALEQWDDIWLNEGFATFAHWLWMEESFGRGVYEEEVRRAYSVFSGLNLVEGGTDPDEALDRALAAFPAPDDPRAADLFNASVYERGALTLVALRDEVGDDRLFDFFATYTDRYVGETISTEAFLSLVGEELGDEREALVRAWVQDPVVPALPAWDLAASTG